MRWLLVAALVAATACGGKPACKLAPVPPGLREAPFLWRVQRPGSVATLWLFGTIHAAGIDAVPKRALDEIAAAPRVVTELGDTKPDPDVFREYARIKRGPGIDHQLDSDDWYDLRDALRGAIKEDDLRRAAPWYAMSLLTTHSTAKPGPSMDMIIADRARSVEALETWQDQLKLLSGVVDLDDLREAIHARETMKCDLARLDAAYAAGDTVTMTALLVLPQTAEKMLYVRNRAWLPKLEAYFASGGAFVAVGLGHMLGAHGLPDLFSRAGYSVERVTR